jgi:hypothetical protein
MRSIIRTEVLRHLFTNWRLTSGHNTTGTQQDQPNGSLIALSYSLQATNQAPMQGISYSVRSACMGSIEAARRAGKMVAIKPETASKTQTDRFVIGSCRPTPKRNA